MKWKTECPIKTGISGSITYELIDEHFQGRVVVHLCPVEVDKEEDVSPHVVFMSDVMIKPLKYYMLLNGLNFTLYKG